MKIAAVQLNIAWVRPEKNISRIMELINGAEPSDLYILPEMFATGFAVRSEKISVQEGEGVMEALRLKAVEKKGAIAGSLAVRTKDGEFRNRFYFFKPDGSGSYYDKRHLFSYGGENKNFSAGAERLVVEHGGFRFLLQVCYDLRFPVFSRNFLKASGEPDYDAVIYVANWPEQRIKAWDILLKARAVENQAFVIGVNRCGADPGNKYNGHSSIISPYGDIIASDETGRECVIYAELDLALLKDFRQSFPVLADADSFNIINKK